ncbi:hypothetical protein ACEV84_22935, partial [Vibrio parahaemolyticus]
EKASGRLPDDLTKTQGTTKRGTTRKGDFAQGIISKTHSTYNAQLRCEARNTVLPHTTLTIKTNA